MNFIITPHAIDIYINSQTRAVYWNCFLGIRIEKGVVHVAFAMAYFVRHTTSFFYCTVGPREFLAPISEGEALRVVIVAARDGHSSIMSIFLVYSVSPL